jgi:hypothetical protein
MVDLLKSISLRTLRYVRLGLAASPDSLEASLRRWRALQRAVARGDVEQTVRMVAERIDGVRVAAVNALALAQSSPPAAAPEAPRRARARARAA